jgi:hypothetical protein
MSSRPGPRLPRHLGRWVAAPAFLVVLASAAISLHGVHARDVPCLRAIAAPSLDGDPLALPIVARPGPVRDLDSVPVPGQFRFERDVGAVRMRYELAPDEERRWGVGRATIVDGRACDLDGLTVDVPTPSSDVVLRRAPGDVYVLTADDAAPVAYVPFRSVPAGSRLVWSGAAPGVVSLGALAALAVAWFVALRARRRVERHATWEEGVVAVSSTVVPAEGGAALFTRSHGAPVGTRVLFSPPPLATPYRDAQAHVEITVGSRSELAAWHVARRRLAFALVAVSLAASVVALSLAFAR